MQTVRFGCEIASTDFSVPMGMEVWIDQQLIFDQDHIQHSHSVEHEISDDDGEHELRFVLKNKPWDHTKVDADGNIISDACVSVKCITFDGIDCDYLTTVLAEYQHDFNGTGEPVTEKFYGELGCNGTVTLQFSTPVYLWLLENM